jgi:CyaY protein
MDDFEQRTAATLEAISQAIEDSGMDCDLEQKGDGVLEITLADGSRVIVNRQAAASEIWVAAKSGGYHFRFDGGTWVNTRDGGELFASLSRYLSEQSGEPVILRA